ncbi:hypothetical protein ACPCTG_31580 [Streptomyces pseudogriseolus]|uniref:hypothetical protein n=1 Tax=Streptomyces pseudogriseolus TaxID=36817 RepID=UPI003FA1AED8
MARTSSTRNTTAKKTTPRKTSSPRTTRNTTAKKTTPAPAKPRLSLIKPTPEQPRLSLIKTPTPALPTRHSDYLTDAQIYAVHAARTAGVPVHRIREWRDHRNNTATRPLTDGSLLHYDHNTRTLTWHAQCPMGATHVYTLTTPSTAAAARVLAARCHQPHADLTHLKPLSRDEWEALGLHTGPTWARPDLLDETPTETIPVPLPTTEQEPEPRTLADQLARTHADAADTQPLSRDQIAAGLEARADNDQPKEHPQP